MGILASGGADAVIAGGVETMSDVPIRVSRSLRKILLSLNKAKTMGARLGLLSSIRPKHFAPEVQYTKTYKLSHFINHCS
jgi:acetyl-CoA acyltransferase